MSGDSVQFWAKTTPDGQPGISVRDHCLNVGCVAEALVGSLPRIIQRLLPRGTANLAALHDVGKISPGFQQKCPAWILLNQFTPQAAETDHAKVSQWFLQQWFGPDARKLKRWLMAVGAHHGQSKGPWISPIALTGPTGDQHWQMAREQLAGELTTFFGALGREELLPRDSPPGDAVLALFAGLITAADWIGSDEHFFSPFAEHSVLTPEQRRRSASGAVAAIGLDAAPAVRTVDFGELFRPLDSPNVLQALAAQFCWQPGLWIIESCCSHRLLYLRAL